MPGIEIFVNAFTMFVHRICLCYEILCDFTYEICYFTNGAYYQDIVILYRKPGYLIGTCCCFRYLMNHLNNLFAGAFEMRDMSPIPVNQQKATPSQGQTDYHPATNTQVPKLITCYTVY